MSDIPNRYAVATRFAALEHARNRLAVILLFIFIPVWVLFIDFIVPKDPVRFRFRADDMMITVDGRHLSLLTGDLNAVTLIVGFMMFTATRRSASFDRRLVLAGYPQSYLILAKLSALLGVATVVAGYATVVIRLLWAPEELWLLGLSLFVAALAYGGLGILLGVLLPGDLEGLFVIIMISLVDTLIQNPIGNPAANEDIVRFFPTYGSMQLGVAGGFTDKAPLEYALIGLAWFVGTGIVGLVVFQRRTRMRTRRTKLRRGR